MFKFLNLDSPFYRFLAKLTNYMILGVTYVISCIPIITIGAASTACYITHHKVIENDQGYVWQTYWQQFRANFKKGTLLWILMLLLTAFLVADCLITYMFSVKGTPSYYLFILMVVLSGIFITWMRYWFPYIAHVEDPIRTVLKNTLVMCIIHLPYSICIAAIYAVSAFLIILFSFNPVAIVFAPILYTVVSYRAFTKVFINYWDMSDGYTDEEETEE